MTFGTGGVGTSRLSSCATRRSIAAGSGCSCTRNRAATRAASSRCATCSLARIIRCSITQCASVWISSRAATTLPVVVELELRLGALDAERAARQPRLAQLAGERPRQGQRLGDRRRRAARRRRRCGRPARTRGGRRSGSGCGRRTTLRARPPGPIEISDRDRAARHAGHEAAGLGGQRVRQHRLDRPRHVDAVAPPLRLPVQRAAGPHERGHVRDVDVQAQPVPVALDRDRVVEVLRARPDRS